MSIKKNNSFSNLIDCYIDKIKSTTIFFTSIFFNRANFLKVFLFGLLMFFWGCSPGVVEEEEVDFGVTEGEDKVYITEVSGHGGWSISDKKSWSVV